MNTFYNKDKKEMVSILSLGPAKEWTGETMGQRILTITTSKYERYISTSASVDWHGPHSRQHIYSFSGDKNADYSARLQTEICPRATEKVIRAYHAKAEPIFELVIKRAKEHYNVGT